MVLVMMEMFLCQYPSCDTIPRLLHDVPVRGNWVNGTLHWNLRLSQNLKIYLKKKEKSLK